jgi:UTP--glucose-1-phosphate uridylyltransferase
MSKTAASPIRAIVIPVAGLGTRLMPATKVVPKVLLPIGRKPLILHAVEEAVAAGAECVVLVANRRDSLIQKYFEPNAELEDHLRQNGRDEEAASLNRVAELISIVTVLQESPNGLADAIRCARPILGNQPFGVILPDALILARRPAIRQLIDEYASNPSTLIATRIIPRQETQRYGILVPGLQTSTAHPRLLPVRALVEKPRSDVTPSLYGIFGRYILEPSIFSAIDSIRPDRSDELQLTDALNRLCASHPVNACLFEGDHYDTGEWLGFAQAAAACMLADPAYGAPFSKFLHTLPDRVAQDASPNA